jgi:hypothetical protein
VLRRTRFPGALIRGRRPRGYGIFALLVIALTAALRASTAPAASGVFSLDRLRLGGSSGAEDYVFTAGNVIFPDGGADTGSYYKFVVTDSGGTVRNPGFPCTPASSFSSTDNTYLVQASDPASTGTGWMYTLKQYATSDCTGGATKSASKTFYVAQATVYADPALTTPKTAFAAGTTAYVTVTGVTPSLTGWSTTWLLPSGATACANTAGTDRADSSSSSNLPPKWTNSDLQYRPNTTATGSAWNREANYEVRPCPSFGTSNEGTWKLRLDGNPTNFVVLPVFTVDATPPPAPTITSAPADPSNAASASFGFSDTEAGVGFRCQLDGGGFGACSSPATYGPLGDGSHTFDVKAVDAAGNESGATTRAWRVDTTPPFVSLTTPADGSSTADATPSFSGSAGGANGDSSTVSVLVYSGASATEHPCERLVPGPHSTGRTRWLQPTRCRTGPTPLMPSRSTRPGTPARAPRTRSPSPSPPRRPISHLRRSRERPNGASRSRQTREPGREPRRLPTPTSGVAATTAVRIAWTSRLPRARATC